MVATTEKEVEFYWRTIFDKLGFKILSPYGCDMYAEKDDLSILGEFKHNYNFDSVINFSCAMTQITRYLHKFKTGKENLVYPSVVFMGNENEAIFVYTTELEDIIENNSFDWNKAPSSFDTKDNLLKEILKRDFIKIRVPADENALQEIRNIIELLKRSSKIFVTIDNFVKVAEWMASNLKISYRIALELLVYQVIDPAVVIVDSKKKRIRIGRKRIKNLNFDKFMKINSLLDLSELSKQEEELRRKFDKLRGIEERVKYGVYYTPLDIVKISHEYLESVLGKDFYNKYVVWDPAAGTGNLTIGKKFKYLFSTTIDQVEHDIKMELGVNPEAVHEIHDFLADPFDHMLREKYPVLDDAIKKGKILFYFNPPYKGENNFKFKNKINKNQKCSLDTYIKTRRLTLANIAYKFLFKVLNLVDNSKASNVFIGVFLPIGIFTKVSQIPFLRLFLSKFDFVKGFLFDSRRFENIYSPWPITFTIWKKKNKTEKPNDHIKIGLDLVDDEFKWFDNKFYLQIILKKDEIFPKHCPLCEKHQIGKHHFTNKSIIYSGTTLYNINPGVFTNKINNRDQVCIHNIYENSFSTVALVSISGLFPFCHTYIKKPDKKYTKKTDMLVLNNLTYLSLSNGFLAFSLRKESIPFKDPPNSWGFRDYIQRNPDGTYKLYNHFFPFEEWFVKRLYKRYNRKDLLDDYESYDNKRLVQEIIEKKKQGLLPEIAELLKFAKRCFIFIAEQGFPDIEVGDVPFRVILSTLVKLGFKDVQEQYIELSRKAYRRLIKEMHDIGMI